MHPVGVRMEVGVEVLAVLKQAVVVGEPDEDGEVSGEVVEVDVVADLRRELLIGRAETRAGRAR